MREGGVRAPPRPRPSAHRPTRHQTTLARPPRTATLPGRRASMPRTTLASVNASCGREGLGGRGRHAHGRASRARRRPRTFSPCSRQAGPAPVPARGRAQRPPPAARLAGGGRSGRRGGRRWWAWAVGARATRGVTPCPPAPPSRPQPPSPAPSVSSSFSMRGPGAAPAYLAKVGSGSVGVRRHPARPAIVLPCLAPLPRPTPRPRLCLAGAATFRHSSTCSTYLPARGRPCQAWAGAGARASSWRRVAPLCAARPETAPPIGPRHSPTNPPHLQVQGQAGRARVRQVGAQQRSD